VCNPVRWPTPGIDAALAISIPAQRIACLLIGGVCASGFAHIGVR